MPGRSPFQRSILVYNDTEATVTVNLGAGQFVMADGTAYGATVDIRGFSGVVLIPQSWAVDPVKVK